MVAGSSAHWHSPRSQAFSRGPAQSLPAHPASKNSVTLPIYDGAGGNLGSSAQRLPLVPGQQYTGPPLSRVKHCNVGSSSAPISLDTAPTNVACRLPDGAQTQPSTSGWGPGPRPVARDAPDPAALTSWIKSSRNIARLQRLVRQYGSKMNHIHVSAVMTHLSQLASEDGATAAALSTVCIASSHRDSGLSPGPPGSWQDTYSVSITSSEEDIVTRPLEGIVAAGLTDVSSSSCSGMAMSGHGDTGSSSADPIATDTASSSHSTHSVSSNEGLHDLLRTLLRLVHDQLQYFEPRQLANTAWALGKWPAGLLGRDDTLAAILHASSPKLQRFGAQELSNVLHGWASCATSSRAAGGNIGTAPDPLSTSAYDRAPTRTSALPPLCTREQGIIFPQVENQSQANHHSTSRLKPKGFLMRHNRACVSQLRWGNFKMQELSNILWAWGVLLGAGVAGFGMESCSGSSWADEPMSEDGTAAVPGALSLPYRELLSAQLQLGLASAHPQELANSMLSLARLQLLPPVEWFEAFLLASRKHLLAGVDQEPGDRCRGIGADDRSAADTSGDPALATRGSATAPGRVGFSPQELSNLLWGCSKLRLQLPPAFLDDVAPALERSLPLMTLPERVNVLWALAWQAKLNAGEWGGLWDAAAEPQAAAASRLENHRLGREGLRTGRWGVGPGQGDGDMIADEGQETVGARDYRSGADTALGERGQQGLAWAEANPWVQVPETTSNFDSMGREVKAERPADCDSEVSDHVNNLMAVASQRRTVTGSGSAAATAVDTENAQSVPPSPRPTPPPPPPRPSSFPRMVTASADSTAAAGCQARMRGDNQPQPERSPMGRDPAALAPKQQERYQEQSFPSNQYQLEINATQPGKSMAQLRGRLTTPGNAAAPLARRVVLAVLEPLQCTPGALAPLDVSFALWSVATLATVRGRCTVRRLTEAGSTRFQADDILTNDSIHNDIYSDPETGAGDDVTASSGVGDSVPTANVMLLTPRDAGVLVQLWGRWLEDMTPQGQANCIWAAARLQLRLPVQLQGRLLAWLLQRAQDFAPASSAAVLRGLGILNPDLRPSPELARTALAFLNQAYLRHAHYSLGELAQVCHGGALLLRCLGRSVGPSAPELDGAEHEHQTSLPASAAIRMSIDLEDAGMTLPSGGGSVSPVVAAAAAVATAAQQRRLARPLDALLARLQQAYVQRKESQREPGAASRSVSSSSSLGRVGKAVSETASTSAGAMNYSTEPDCLPSALGLEVVVMTLEAVAIMLPIHGSSVRGSELSAWCQDLVRVHARRALTQVPHHVRTLAPLLYAITVSAASSVRSARARRQAERERRRAAAAGPSVALARSSIDEFSRSGRLAERREALMQMRQAQEQLDTSQQQSALQQQQKLEQQSQRITVDMEEQTQAQQLQHMQIQQPQQQQQPGSSPQSATLAASGLSADWLQRFWAASAPSLKDATPKEAAMMLWAMSLLAVQPPDAWVRTLLRVVKPYLSAVAAGRNPGHPVSDQTLGIMLLSLGLLRVRPSPQWMAAALEAVGARAMGDGCSKDGSRHREMDPTAVLGVLCGLAHLEWPVPADWLARLVRGLAPQMGRLTAPERTRAYMALASLDATLADRVGFEFSELLAVGRASRGPPAGAWAADAAELDRGDEGTAQQRTLFSRSRGGW